MFFFFGLFVYCVLKCGIVSVVALFVLRLKNVRAVAVWCLCIDPCIVNICFIPLSTFAWYQHGKLLQALFSKRLC